ncbi:MAG: hypothetical protein GY920_10700 [Aliivibrio sp.]|nr:hypothetical protein [Aliivibrio sp.]
MSALRFLRQAAPGFKGRLPEGFVRSFAKPTGPVPRYAGKDNPIVGPITRQGTRPQGITNNPGAIVTPGINKSLIQQASQYLPKSPMGYLGRGMQGLGAVDVVNKLRKGDYVGAATETALLFPGKTLGAARSLLFNPVSLGTAGLLTASELMFPAKAADGTMDSPEAKRMKETFRTQEYDKEQGADLDMEAIRNLPGGSANPSPLPPFNPNQDLPASAEQSVDTSPFQHQMAIYEQGRNAATTQAERNQVRDLGLAIHKAHNPQLYSSFQTPMASDRTFNPLMANTFPDSYPQTREAFIAEGGVQMPQTMNNVDARNELIEGNRLEGEQMAGQFAASLEAQEFMKKFLAGQK